MIASRVAKEGEIHDALKARGFEPTKEETDTGTFWRHSKTGKHAQVPKSVQGFYPTWLLDDMEPGLKKAETE